MGLFKKNILATLTTEELDKFKELTAEEVAIRKMAEGLTSQMKEVVKGNREMWKEVMEKYNLEGSLELDEETGNVTLNKD